MAPLPLLSPVSIGVEAIIADHHLCPVRDVGGDSGDELQVVHPNVIGIILPMQVYDLALGLIEWNRAGGGTGL